MTAPVVSVKGVVKRFGGLAAVDGVDLDIEDGEIFALLGPNGAGKTTLISIVAGLLRPSAGEVTVLGHDVVKDYRLTRRAVGLVPQEINFDPFVTVEEALRFQAGYFGIRLTDARLTEILDALDLDSKRKANTRSLSGGMKRRLLIGKALVHEPRVLFLDEPTAGVDVELRRSLWAYVRTLRARGTTVVLTTHYLDEAEELADRIGVIDHGRLVVVEEKQALLRRYGGRTFRLALEAPLSEVPPGLAALGARLEPPGDVISIETSGSALLGPALRAAEEAGLVVRDAETRRTTLEDVFVRLVTDGEGDGVISYGLRTLVVKEVRRFMRVPGQTLLSPLITTTLYLVVFGWSLGGSLREIHGVSYARFIVPGLVALGVVTNAYLNTASSMFVMKLQGTIVDLLVAPLSYGEILVGFLTAAVCRGLLVGGITWLVAGALGGFELAHPFAALALVLLAAIAFASLGLITAIWATTFEQVNFVPTFFITPLTFLGGVFYSVEMLPPGLRAFTLWNPVFYMVDGMRFGMIGVSDASPWAGAAALGILALVSTGTAYALLRSGYRLRG